MKKGFTLAELIGVIVVLALISLITIPVISRILKQNKTALCETQMNNILEAARAWGADNVFLLPTEDGRSKTITLQDLVDGGYIEKDIENPATKIKMTVYEGEHAENTIEIKKQGKGWKYTLNPDSADFNCDIDADTED